MALDVDVVGATLDHVADVVIIGYSPDRRVRYASPSLRTVFGWDPAEVIGTEFGLSLPEERARLSAEFESALADGRGPVRLRYQVATSAGGRRWADCTWAFVRGADGALAFVVMTARDVTDDVGTRRRLEASEQRFRLAMDSAPAGMAVVDLDRRFLEVNPALCRMVDRDQEWLLSHGVRDVLDPEDDKTDLQMREQMLSGSTASAAREKRLRRPDGQVVWVQHSIGLLRDDDGTPVSYVSQFVDVSEARAAREALLYLATHDPLTELANRRVLLDRMRDASGHLPRTGTRLAVLYCDLDDLKVVNDQLGHAAGDAVIVATAGRIASQVRADDVVARIGGDEFVVALLGTHGVGDALAVAEKVQAAVSAPLAVAGRHLRPVLSIGVAVATDDEDPESTLHRADGALYRVKRTRRGTASAYDGALDAPARATLPPPR